MKINKKMSVGIVAIIVVVLLGNIMNNQRLMIIAAKEAINNKNIEIEKQKTLLQGEKDYKSEIETIKETAEINKINIIENKENLEEAKRIVAESKINWEKSVWLGRCLDKKLVDTTILCEDENLEDYANYNSGL